MRITPARGPRCVSLDQWLQAVFAKTRVFFQYTTESPSDPKNPIHKIVLQRNRYLPEPLLVSESSSVR
jgi:hypothetical protein